MLTLPNEQLEKYTEEIFLDYREKGFPFYALNEAEKRKEYDKLIAYDFMEILKGKTIKQTMHGLGLAWSYFPHAWEVCCNDKHTPHEVFHDDELFRKAIKRGLKRSGKCTTESDIRKAIRSTAGIQAVSNFRPTAAGAIYEHFAGNGVVWDMSAGFGGRLIGALTSKRVKKYIGTDPCTETFNGLEEIKEDFFSLYDSDKKVELIKVGSENYIPDKNSLDLCFTSPPYFNTEQYSEEDNQSYIKFPQQKKWLYKYLGATIRNCIFGLKNDGYIIINIADVSSYRILCNDFERMMIKEMGLKLVTKLDYLISSYKGGYKSEPLYVFRK